MPSYSHACVMAAGRGRLRAGRCWCWTGGCNPVQSAPINCNLVAAVINQHYESCIMDNVTPLVHGTKSTCSITLNEYQNAHYEQSAIEILAPDGSLLQYIGDEINKEITQTSNYQLRDQVHLLGCLLGCIDHHIELPRYAVSGLADIVNRMQSFCDKRME